MATFNVQRGGGKKKGFSIIDMIISPVALGIKKNEQIKTATCYEILQFKINA